ncbi:hypothetical protein LX78_02958 [Xanthomarina spongicola]|uniref:Uncharacterized protein n=1 Tax=Xanthomarina spongicola TaxID=570520 RepID=A0A316DF52_9FLAO|nr:hypothetical protein LX78_02958 [Xanthomarina spongicola]
MTVSELKEIILNKNQNIQFLEKESDNEVYLEFSTEKNTDYVFFISIESLLTTVDIGAKLNSDINAYFWHQSAEKINTSDKEWNSWIENFILESIKNLSEFETRIIQKNGLIFSSFTCEYFNEKWTKLNTNNGFRWTLKIPKIYGRKKIYK